jgi:hypothetical protein
MLFIGGYMDQGYSDTFKYLSQMHLSQEHSLVI